MNRLSNIDFSLRSLTLNIAIDENGFVEVKDRGFNVLTGTKEYCLDAIRNYMVFFDGSDKKVQFHIYDISGGMAKGTEGKAFFKSRLTTLASSMRANVTVMPHSSSYIP